MRPISLPPESSPSSPNPHAPTDGNDTDTSPPHSDRENPSSTALADTPDSSHPSRARSPHPAKTAHSPAAQKTPSAQNAPGEYGTRAIPGCDSPESSLPHRPDASRCSEYSKTDRRLSASPHPQSDKKLSGCSDLSDRAASPKKTASARAPESHRATMS